MSTDTDRSKTILVVEDEEYLRDLYVQILKQEGYNVEVAVNGEEAYQKMSQKDYDLVILDVILPKMDGLQVVDKLKNEGHSVNKNVVLLSNLGQELVAAKAIDLGVRGYMVKSDYTPEELVKEVGGYLTDDGPKSEL
ncbi:response regulator [Candidatus Roizmanbacteria bacterium]|nr:MAG: response regulator [Candidatus Roizmanbacteria bacterium]